jgi:hypothetical protein
MIPRFLFAFIELVSGRACNSAAQGSWDHGEGGVQRGRMTFLPKELYAELGAEARLGMQEVGRLSAALSGRVVGAAV